VKKARIRESSMTKAAKPQVRSGEPRLVSFP
jgi:hypothetical protein